MRSSLGRIRTIVVDDEELARGRMLDLLAPFDDIQVVGEARNGDEAVTLIDSLHPQLVFLDIQMPGRSGLEVAAALAPPRPSIVYCTAYDQYAVDAFELNALDYLLKPVTRVRLERSLDKVRSRISGNGTFLHEIEMAEAAQARLFPHDLPCLDGLEYVGACHPVRWVSGDYYDFLPVKDRLLGLAIGDVSGKGLSAGLLMAGLQGRLRSEAPRFGADLVTLLQSLNRSICETTENSRFVTFFYAVYDERERKLIYVNAGHNPPILVRRPGIADCSIERLDAGGMVLGVSPDAKYEQGSVRIEPGDLLILFTDGVTEVMDSEDLEFGENRLLDLVLRHLDAPLEQLVDGIFEELAAFRGERALEDDVTLVLARGR